MKFEKLNDSKIKIIFTLTDIMSNDFSVDEFFENNSVSSEFLESVLGKAEKEIGFKTDDCKLLVEAIKSSKNEMVFTITKICESDNLDVYLNLAFKFDCLDDFLNLCTYMKNMDFSNLDNCHALFSLYLYNNSYYLCISNYGCLNGLVLNVFNEFAKKIPYTARLDGMLCEYGKALFKEKDFCSCLNMA